MNAVGFVMLCVMLVVGCISVRAEDSADQAAARAALEQRLFELDHSDARPPSASNSAVTATQATAPVATVTKTGSAVPAATAPADTVFTSSVPAANTSAQAAALAAMQQRMNELSGPGAQPPSDTNAPVAPVVIPVNEASAAATPVTEAPAAEVPVAVAPTIAPAAVTPVSSAPAVVAPVPKVAAVPAAAVIPAAAPETDTMPTRTLPTAGLPTSSAGQIRPFNELVTTTGATYRNVEVQRITSDAIVISYTPAQGGWAMTRINFRDLPPDIRQQYEK